MSLVKRFYRTRRFVRSLIADWRLDLPTAVTASRIAAKAIYVGDGMMLTRVIGRIILYLPARDTSVVPSLLIQGYWERRVTRALVAHLRPGMIVGDVGANVGYFSALMAERIGPTGHVHAFEANTALAALIERSLFVNGFHGRATVHPIALGDEDGRAMVLCLPGDALGGGWLQASDAGVANGQPVTLRRLDAIPGAERIELLKIDAEGSEPLIWAGMAGLIAGETLRTVLMEFSAGAYADPAGFLDAIATAGFAVRQIDQHIGLRDRPRDWLLAPEQAHTTVMLLLTR